MSRDPVLTVRYTLPQGAQVMMALDNTMGQRVATLANEEHAAGIHEIGIDGTRLATGMYRL